MKFVAAYLSNPLKKVSTFALIALTILCFQSCERIKKPEAKTSAKPKQIKNLIFMIGDGMGLQQISFARSYLKYAPNNPTGSKQLKVEQIASEGDVGLVYVEPYGALVVDSASSATQYATGYPALSEVIGLGQDGHAIETILEKAVTKGLATGLVSDTRLTHATPASFGAHVAHRSMENKIAEHLVRSGTDVLYSGGLRHFLPKNVGDKQSPNAIKYEELFGKGSNLLASSRKDDRDLIAEAKSKGYDFVFDKQSMKNSKNSQTLGLFTTSGMPDGIKHRLTKDDPSRTIPTLKEMTEDALDRLSKNPKGFFLMVEGGQVDWMGHQNDAGGVLQEMLKFDETVGYVLDWVKKRDDTLLVVTADHETGSMGFSYTALDLPQGEQLESKSFISRLFKPNFNFGRYTILDKMYDQKKSLNNIVKQYLKRKTQSPESFRQVVKDNTGFEITLSEARSFFELVENEHRVKGHTYLDVEKSPDMGPSQAFYGLIGNNYATKLGQILGSYQNVTWGSGTHTSTPVGVFAYGPKNWTEKYRSMSHSTEIGQINLQALGLPTNKVVLDID